MTVKFEAGKTYSTRSVCDHNCIITVSIERRTAKTVVTTEGKRFGIRVWEDEETFMPWGSYSMPPIMRASDSEIK